MAKRGRPRLQLPEEQLEAMFAQGMSNVAIAAALDVGEMTIQRARARRANPLAGAEILPDPDVPIPEGTDPVTVDRWIGRIEKLALEAERKGEIGALHTLGRLMATLMEHRRKAMPPPIVDVNARPDMLAAKERARAAFNRLFDAITNRTEPR